MGILIGLTGRAGSGKDTAADALVEQFGFVKMAFAAPLKRTASVLFNLPECYFHDRDLKEKPLEDWDNLSPRHMLQLLGTESVRNVFGDNFWIKRWISEYGQMTCDTNVVVTDVRYNNEAEAIRSLGGVIIHVRRPGENGLDSSAGSHSSEKGVDFNSRRDSWVNNTGSIEDLHKKMRAFFTLEDES